VKLLFPDKFLLVLLAVGIFTLVFSSVSFAPTKMSDSDLADVEGQALFSITQYTNSTMSSGGWVGTDSSNVVRISLGIDMEMNAHIRSFKLGYYDGGWDQDTTNYFWGSTDHVTSPLTWTGVFLDFGFDNISDNATRTLNYIEIGTMSASGKITGTINTINGFALSGGTGQNAGVMLRQTASGTRTVHFDNDIMSFVFAAKYRYTDQTGDGTPNLSGIFIKIPSYDTDLTT
jgi:hypothetical protein